MKYLLFIFLFIISKYNFGQSPDYGLKVFKKANCNSCHQWHGDGGESYGCEAASIRETGLDKSKSDNFGYYLHILYEDNIPTSPHYETIMKSVYKKLDIKSIIRVKINSYLKDNKLIEHELHTDYNYSNNAKIKKVLAKAPVKCNPKEYHANSSFS